MSDTEKRESTSAVSDNQKESELDLEARLEAAVDEIMGEQTGAEGKTPENTWEKFTDLSEKKTFEKMNYEDGDFEEEPEEESAEAYDTEFIGVGKIPLEEAALTLEVVPEENAEKATSEALEEDSVTMDLDDSFVDEEGFYTGEPEDEMETGEYVPAPKKKRNKSARPVAGVSAVPHESEEKEKKAEKKAENEILAPAVLEEEKENPPRKKHKAVKCLGLVAAMLAVTAGTAYAGISYYFSNRFFDGTTINGMDVSRKTALEVEEALEKKVEGYSIEVLARNQQPQKIDGSAINYRYMSDGEVLDYLKSQKPYEWVMGYIEPKTYTVQESTTYDKEKLKTEIRQLECAKAENQVQPENAYVAFTDTKFEVIPETEGSALDIKQAYQVLEAAVTDSQTSVDFTAVPGVYEQAAITKDDANIQATVDACNNFTRASITYDFGEETVVLDGSVIKDWLEFDDRNQLVQNDSSFQQHIGEFVDQLKQRFDTVGTSREFYTTSGRVVYVYGSAYGWKIDRDAEIAQLTEEIKNGAQIEREPVYAMAANSRGYNDLGNTYIEVDLAYQHMYYYQNGAIIFDSDFVSGNPNYEDRVTPPGIFTLYYKKSPAVLRGRQDENGKYEYETDVTYWMPFNGGVGFHDATWQPDFGGDMYLWNGSHGCINLPYYSAATLYDIIQYDVPIIVFN